MSGRRPGGVGAGAGAGAGAYLGFSRFAVMVRDPDLVKEPVQLADDGVDLLGQVAGVHVAGWVRGRRRMAVGGRRVGERAANAVRAELTPRKGRYRRASQVSGGKVVDGGAWHRGKCRAAGSRSVTRCWRRTRIPGRWTWTSPQLPSQYDSSSDASQGGRGENRSLSLSPSTVVGRRSRSQVAPGERDKRVAEYAIDSRCCDRRGGVRRLERGSGGPAEIIGQQPVSPS